MIDDNFMKLKDFNEKTITEDFVSELCALVAWSELSKTKYKNNNTFIVKDLPAQGKSKTGKGYLYPWDESQKHLYDKIETGVEITISVTKQTIKLWNTGRVICFYSNDGVSEFEYIVRNKITGEEKINEQMTYPASSLDLVNLFIKHGFIKIKENE